VGLAPSFSGAGVTAHNTPEPKKSEIEMKSEIRIDLLNLNLIGPPKITELIQPTLKVKRTVIYQRLKQI
jgi:hypothetical protein